MAPVKAAERRRGRREALTCADAPEQFRSERRRGLAQSLTEFVEILDDELSSGSRGADQFCDGESHVGHYCDYHLMRSLVPAPGVCAVIWQRALIPGGPVDGSSHDGKSVAWWSRFDVPK
jgi:hypothetical protein